MTAARQATNPVRPLAAIGLDGTVRAARSVLRRLS